MLVDALGVAAQREDEHHVGEVDRLTPRRGPDLDEEHVDHLEVAVAHHEVRRLDVAVREPRVPHLPHEAQALVDHGVVDVGVADLDRAVEELHHDHVLALGRDLDDPVGRGRREPVVLEQPQRVVLVLDEPADRLERGLVLERAVQDRAAGLVPAVGPHVALRVELGEDVSLGPSSFHPEPERRRASRPLEPDGLHLDDLRPSWSRTARTIASPRCPPTSRCAAFPRRYGPGTGRWGRTSGNRDTAGDPEDGANHALEG